MKEINQAENDLKEKRVDAKLYLKDGMWNCLITSYDVRGKQGMYSLDSIPFFLQEAQHPNLRTIEKCVSDNCLHEIELGCDILKLPLEALYLNEG